MSKTTSAATGAQTQAPAPRVTTTEGGGVRFYYPGILDESELGERMTLLGDGNPHVFINDWGIDHTTGETWIGGIDLGALEVAW